MKDVSTFLSDLKLGKEPTSRDAGKIKNKTAPKDRTEKKAKGKQPIVHDSGHAAASMDAKETSSNTFLPKGSHKLVFPPGPHWYSAVSPLPPTDTSSAVPSASQLSSLNEKAANLLHKDAEVYQTSSASTGHSTSDSHFLQTILAKGTLSDRLSALTLLVQASPVHNIKALENLKNMAERGRGKGGREEGLKAMRCVIDWWVGGGAPGWKLR